MELRFILGFLFFVFAFAVSILNVFVCFKLITKITRYNDIRHLQNNNVAVSLVLAGAFISLAIMTRNALYPINAVFQDLWFLFEKSPAQISATFGYAVGYLLLTYALSLFSVAAASFLFQKFTRNLEEEKEIRGNNVAVGLLLAGVLTAFALLIESGIANFVNTLIPIKEFIP